MSEKMNILGASPKVVCIFSGKRKCGKDFVVEKLKSLIGQELCEVVRLSGPLKQQYAIIHGLDFNKLLDSSSYKEIYRKDMIKWGEDQRNQDSSYFCNLAARSAYTKDNIGNPSVEVTKQIWFISDARRVTDLQYFRTNYRHVLHVRVEALNTVRESRGWVFTSSVDDAESECGLDDEVFDVVIRNDGDDNQLMTTLMSLWDNIRHLVLS